MMNKVQLLVLAALTFASAGCSARPAEHGSNEYTSASADEGSWGALLKRWRVDADGHVVMYEFTPFPSPDTETKRDFRLTTKEMAEVRRALAGLARYRAVTSNWNACGASTDPPYTDVTLGDGRNAERMSFALGCTTKDGKAREAEYRRVLALLDAASAGTRPIKRHFRRVAADYRSGLCPKGYWYRGYPIEDPCARN